MGCFVKFIQKASEATSVAIFQPLALKKKLMAFVAAEGMDLFESWSSGLSSITLNHKLFVMPHLIEVANFLCFILAKVYVMIGSGSHPTHQSLIKLESRHTK